MKIFVNKKMLSRPSGEPLYNIFFWAKYELGGSGPMLNACAGMSPSLYPMNFLHKHVLLYIFFVLSLKTHLSSLYLKTPFKTRIQINQPEYILLNPIFFEVACSCLYTFIYTFKSTSYSDKLSSRSSPSFFTKKTFLSSSLPSLMKQAP